MLNGTRRNGSANGVSKSGTNGAGPSLAIAGDHDRMWLQGTWKSDRPQVSSLVYSHTLGLHNGL